METRTMTPPVPHVTQVPTGLGNGRHVDDHELPRWAAQLDAAQRQAYAAHIQDRIRVLDRILRLVVNAKREGRLCCDHARCASRSRAVPKYAQSDLALVAVRGRSAAMLRCQAPVEKGNTYGHQELGCCDL